jgi:hypothetical protein
MKAWESDFPFPPFETEILADAVVSSRIWVMLVLRWFVSGPELLRISHTQFM